MRISRVINTVGFENAVREYVLAGVTNASEISRLLCARGCFASGVAVELCIERLAILDTAKALNTVTKLACSVHATHDNECPTCDYAKRKGKP